MEGRWKRRLSNSARRYSTIEFCTLIEACSPGPCLELFARGTRPGWSAWGNQAEEYEASWPTCKNASDGSRQWQQMRLVEEPTPP